MTTQSTQNTRYPVLDTVQRTQDVLLVSSFVLWAALVGVVPVLAFHALAGS